LDSAFSWFGLGDWPPNGRKAGKQDRTLTSEDKLPTSLLSSINRPRTSTVTPLPLALTQRSRSAPERQKARYSLPADGVDSMAKGISEILTFAVGMEIQPGADHRGHADAVLVAGAGERGLAFAYRAAVCRRN
jgi:hypothetical protein